MLIYSSPSVCPPALCFTVVCFLVLSGPTGKRVYLLPPPLSLSLCPVFSLVICLSTPLVMSPTLSLPLFFLGGFSQGGVASGRAGLQKASRTLDHNLHLLTKMLPSTWHTPITIKGSGARACPEQQKNGVRAMQSSSRFFQHTSCCMSISWVKQLKTDDLHRMGKVNVELYSFLTP